MTILQAPTRGIARGFLQFSIESRILRELGERLVRRPDVALLELVKNAYDADAETCTVQVEEDWMSVTDTGEGMTLSAFEKGWMRLGTGGKSRSAQSARYGRSITGEKGIGRLAVRYLGERLDVDTVAWDEGRQQTTRLRARFRWTKFDRQQDLGAIRVPYVLSALGDDAQKGTTLTISNLRPAARDIDWKALRTGSIGVVSPIRSLLRDMPVQAGAGGQDPGFSLALADAANDDDITDRLLGRYTLKASLEVTGRRFTISVSEPNADKPRASVDDLLATDIGDVHADIRFFPRRSGAFKDVGVDGRRAYTWVRENSGVLVFDRGFQMRPYGLPGDDWLGIVADAARNLRDPASMVTRKHYGMTPEVKASTKLNWMLRLPEAAQLIGVVQVRGLRGADELDPNRIGQGLVAAADREGFLDNEAFRLLVDVVRGAVEMIAYVDREMSNEQERHQAEENMRALRAETQAAVRAIETDATIPMQQRDRIVHVLRESQERAERQDEGARERERQLEIMSLLGVVAGFMTHEFGVALSELRGARDQIREAASQVPGLGERAQALETHISKLTSFVRYSKAYIGAVKSEPSKHYPARARFNHVVKTFGHFAEKRRIEVSVEVDPEVMAPLIPAALYDGIAQNLFTNALKAIIASTDTASRRIVFRAWNDAKWHRMQVSDTGIGIPSVLQDKVFDPLFTTTANSQGPLGSGMGLGLALVRRGATAFGGSADLVQPPPGFSTCVEVRFPLQTETE